MAAGWGPRPAPGRGGAWRWLLAALAALVLVAVRYDRAPRLTAARAAVARAATTAVGVPRPVQGIVARVEAFVRGGLDGQGWRWPPLSGGVRVEPPPPATPPLRYPVAGAILMPFGPGVDPLTGRKVQMDGLLLGAVAGAPVRSPAAATVRAVRDGPAVGEEVVLAVAGRPRLEVDLMGVTAVAVRAGMHVSAGQRLGQVPAMGPGTAPHMVVEVRVGGIAVDPLSPLYFGAPT